MANDRLMYLYSHVIYLEFRKEIPGVKIFSSETTL